MGAIAQRRALDTGNEDHFVHELGCNEIDDLVVSFGVPRRWQFHHFLVDPNEAVHLIVKGTDRRGGTSVHHVSRHRRIRNEMPQ